MNRHQLKVGIGAVGITIAVALVPAGTSWAHSHKSHHKSHHTSKSTTAGAASCPTAATLSAAASTTYTGPTTQKAAEKGWVVCEYSSQSQIALLVSLYTTNDSLRSISANAPAATTKISGLGNAASHYGTDVFVQRDSAPSFSVIDQTSDLTLSQTKAMAKAIVAG
jgi:hypothetical protein